MTQTSKTSTAGERVIHKTDTEWREELTPHQYDILRRHGTEPPFTGEYVFKSCEASASTTQPTRSTRVPSVSR